MYRIQHVNTLKWFKCLTHSKRHKQNLYFFVNRKKNSGEFSPIILNLNKSFCWIFSIFATVLMSDYANEGLWSETAFDRSGARCWMKTLFTWHSLPLHKPCFLIIHFPSFSEFQSFSFFLHSLVFVYPHYCRSLYRIEFVLNFFSRVQNFISSWLKKKCSKLNLLELH